MHVAGALLEQAIEREGALQTLSSLESTLDSRLELPKGPSCARVDDFERFCILLLLESTLPGPRESRLEPHKRDFRPLRVDSSTCREREAAKSSTRAPLAPQCFGTPSRSQRDGGHRGDQGGGGERQGDHDGRAWRVRQGCIDFTGAETALPSPQCGRSSADTSRPRFSGCRVPLVSNTSARKSLLRAS